MSAGETVLFFVLIALSVGVLLVVERLDGAWSRRRQKRKRDEG